MTDYEFELDFCVAANMLLGMTYKDAAVKAAEWMDQAHDEDRR